MSSLSITSQRMNSYINSSFKTVGLTKFFQPKQLGVFVNKKYTIKYDEFFIRSINDSEKIENFYYYTISAMDTMLSCLMLNGDKSVRVVTNMIVEMVEKYSLEERVEFSKELYKIITSDLSWENCDSDLKKLVYFLSHITRLYPCSSVEYYTFCIIYIWHKSKENFFKLFLLFTDFAIESIDLELNYLEKTQKKVTKLDASGFVITNTPMFCLAKYIEFCEFYSEMYCDSIKSSKDVLEDMKFFNNTKLGNDELLNERYKHKTIRNFVNKMLEGYIGEEHDDFYNFYQTSDYSLLKSRDTKPLVDVNVSKDETFSMTLINAEVLYRIAKAVGKKVTNKVHDALVAYIPDHLWISFEQNIMFLGYDLLLNDNYEKIIKERDSAKAEMITLNDKYKMARSNAKSSKREADEAKKARYSSEDRLRKCKQELDEYRKESVPKSDFDEFEESYNELLKQISEAQAQLRDVSKKLEEKTSECSRLIKENKQFKSQLLKVKGEQTVEAVQEVTEIPLEEKVEFINNFNVIILGGLSTTAQSLRQLGYNSFTLCNDIGEIVCGSTTDLIVVFTSYVSHKMTNYAKSHYSDIDLQYFNSTSPALLIDLIYNYFSELLAD